jgi:hypothetical protein
MVVFWIHMTIHQRREREGIIMTWNFSPIVCLFCRERIHYGGLPFLRISLSLFFRTDANSVLPHKRDKLQKEKKGFVVTFFVGMTVASTHHAPVVVKTSFNCPPKPGRSRIFSWKEMKEKTQTVLFYVLYVLVVLDLFSL